MRLTHYQTKDGGGLCTRLHETTVKTTDPAKVTCKRCRAELMLDVKFGKSLEPAKEKDDVRAEPGDDNPICNFCGKRRRQALKFVKGIDSHICDECIGLCVVILNEELSPPARAIRLSLAPDTTATECGNCECVSPQETCGAFGFKDLDNNADGAFLRLPRCIAAEAKAGHYREGRRASGGRSEDVITRIMVARYKASCGHTFANKVGAEYHEKRRFCWRLPVLKSCMTCSSHRRVKGNGDLGETKIANECANPKMDRDNPEMFTAISPKVPDVAVNCKLWSPKS